MNIRELASQIIMPRLSVKKYEADKEYKNQIQAIARENVCGFCIFDGNVNSVRFVINDLQMIAESPLIFSADFENGLLMRLDDGSPFPHAMAVGRTSPENANNIAIAISLEMKALGIDWNFAPVCDINSNIKNPIINIRSFSESVEKTSIYIESFINGLQTNKVAATAKHFPGHGDVDTDSHLTLPVLNKQFDLLLENELKPFDKAVYSDVKSIMLGHLNVPEIDNSGLPISLSKRAVEYIRSSMGYEGIILTDALDMGALINSYSHEEIIKLAFEAGNDVLLLPNNPFEAINIIERIIVSDVTYLKQIKESVKRILQLKNWVGLNIPPSIDEKSVNAHFQSNEKLALHTAYSALEVIGDKSLIPITDEKSFAAFAVSQDDDIESGSIFFRMMAQALENECDFGFLNHEISDSDIEALKSGISKADVLIFAFFFKSKAYSLNFELSDKIKRIQKELSSGRPIISILFGNPYLNEIVEYDTLIRTFSDSLSSIAATALKFSGRTLDNY